MFPWKIPETLDKTTPLSPNPPSPLGLQNLPNANLLPNLLPTLCCYLAILKKKKKRKMIVSSACAKAGLGFISKKMEISLPPSPPPKAHHCSVKGPAQHQRETGYRTLPSNSSFLVFTRCRLMDRKYRRTFCKQSFSVVTFFFQ